MNPFKQQLFLTTSIAFILSFFTINAYALTDNTTNREFKNILTKKEKNDESSELGDKCRELALKVDWLGRYQDRPACTQSLDGSPVYFAGYYLDKDKKSKEQAIKLLEETMVKINFAIDVGCYGQDDMKKLVSDIQELINTIN